MRSIERSTQFKRDYKKASKSIHFSELDSRLTEVIGYLVLDCQRLVSIRGAACIAAAVAQSEM
jgi:mRNA-degrading endonuclease YafQ of YafQ-DinJ toxin-antitoxin module